MPIVSDGKIERDRVTMTCTATEAVGEPVYISAADNVRQADATDNTKPTEAIIMDKPTSTSAVCLFKGKISGLSGLTAGDVYYLDTSAGGITTTAPSTTGNIVQKIGTAISTTELLVNIQDFIVVA